MQEYKQLYQSTQKYDFESSRCALSLSLSLRLRTRIIWRMLLLSMFELCLVVGLLLSIRELFHDVGLTTRAQLETTYTIGRYDTNTRDGASRHLLICSLFHWQHAAALLITVIL